MPKYVAFLRAINVGGHVVKMDRLKALFEELPLTDVETYIASGNVIFRSTARAPALETKIAAHLERRLGYPVPAFLRTPAELADAVRTRPFRGAALSKTGAALYVGLVSAEPAAGVRKAFLGMKCATDEFEIRGRELFWLCHKRMLESAYSGGKLEKVLGMPATFRNLNTLEKLAGLHA